MSQNYICFLYVLSARPSQTDGIKMFITCTRGDKMLLPEYVKILYKTQFNYASLTF